MKKIISRVLLAGLLCLPVALVIGLYQPPHKVQAAPGSPGTPEAPIVIYDEDFENSPAASPTLLTSYIGDDSMSYTADSAWLDNCNGEVLFYSMADSQFGDSNCSVGDGTNTTGAFDAVRRLAYALGTLHGGASPSTNRALTAYTDSGATYIDPGADLVQFETVDRVELAAGNRRFIVSNIDAAAINCTNPGTVQGKLTLYLLDDSDVRQINQNVINICTDSAASTVTPPALQSNGSIGPNSGSIQVGSVLTDRALLSESSSVGLRMVNEEGGGLGNDNAIDNIQMVDASPKLDKAFDPAIVEVNGTSRMTFTVTNTTDLLAKEGWSFVDNLPANLVVAPTPNTSTDCPNGSIQATAGAGSVGYSGDLEEGQVSCTLSLDVTSAEPGTYINGPANLEGVVGLHLPADAEVTFTPKAPNTGSADSSRSAFILAGSSTAGLIGLAGWRRFKYGAIFK